MFCALIGNNPLKCASVVSIHSCSLDAPILVEEAEAADVKPAPKGAAAARMLVSNDLAQRRRLFGPEVLLL
jgi:hypothetical protein